MSVCLSVTPAVSGADEQQKTKFRPTYSARFQYGRGKCFVRIATCTWLTRNAWWVWVNVFVVWLRLNGTVSKDVWIECLTICNLLLRSHISTDHDRIDFSLSDVTYCQELNPNIRTYCAIQSKSNYKCIDWDSPCVSCQLSACCYADKIFLCHIFKTVSSIQLTMRRLTPSIFPSTELKIIWLHIAILRFMANLIEKVTTSQSNSKDETDGM